MNELTIYEIGFIPRPMLSSTSIYERRDPVFVPPLNPLKENDLAVIKAILESNERC
jgi:hypothetical protein